MLFLIPTAFDLKVLHCGTRTEKRSPRRFKVVRVRSFSRCLRAAQETRHQAADRGKGSGKYQDPGGASSRGIGKQQQLGRSATFRAFQTAYEQARFRAVNDSARVVRWLRISLNNGSFISESVLRLYQRAVHDFGSFLLGQRIGRNILNDATLRAHTSMARVTEADKLPLSPHRMSQLFAHLYKPVNRSLSLLFRKPSFLTSRGSKAREIASFPHMRRQLLGALSHRHDIRPGSAYRSTPTAESVVQCNTASEVGPVWASQLNAAFGNRVLMAGGKRLLTYFSKSLLVEPRAMKRPDENQFKRPSLGPALGILPVAFALTTASQFALGVSAVGAGVAGLSFAILGFTINKNLDAVRLLPPRGKLSRITPQSDLRSSEAPAPVDVGYQSWTLRRLQDANPWIVSKGTVSDSLENSPSKTSLLSSATFENSQKNNQVQRGLTLSVGVCLPEEATTRTADWHRQGTQATRIRANWSGIDTSSFYQRWLSPNRNKPLRESFLPCRRSRSLSTHDSVHHEFAMMDGLSNTETGCNQKVRAETTTASSFVVDTIGRDLPQERTLLENILQCVDRLLLILETYAQRIIRRTHDLGMTDHAFLSRITPSSASSKREILHSFKNIDVSQ
ncbi:hypothetical protein CCYA_CCYA13G3623 [Cyanidiococcus yangmingshanensis]|nr:hypothetical protein CCYA_CCYA13G3623 [Cyanidiococcus yangmingshanensis]